MKNKLREILNSGRTAIGTHISFADSTVTEIMGLAGYDYLWIDENRLDDYAIPRLIERLLEWRDEH